MGRFLTAPLGSPAIQLDVPFRGSAGSKCMVFWWATPNPEPEPSAPSHDDFRVDRSEFQPRVVDAELPIDAALSFVDGAMPGFGFPAYFRERCKATILQALARHRAEFVLGYVEPTAVLGSVMELQSTQEKRQKALRRRRHFGVSWPCGRFLTRK